MRFPELLRTTVILCGAAATLLAVVTVAGAAGAGDTLLVPLCALWWLAAALFGAMLGRRSSTSHQISLLLSSARTQMSLPEINPGRVVLNRLWPILVGTLAAGAVAFAEPQVPGIAAGFALGGALVLRRQGAAVTAIEERDGARFYVEHNSPLRPIRLIRTPGFRSNLTELAQGRQTRPFAGRRA